MKQQKKNLTEISAQIVHLFQCMATKTNSPIFSNGGGLEKDVDICASTQLYKSTFGVKEATIAL